MDRELGRRAAGKLVFAALIATSSASGFVACSSSQEESAESSHVTHALITSAAADTPIAFTSNKRPASRGHQLGSRQGIG